MRNNIEYLYICKFKPGRESIWKTNSVPALNDCITILIYFLHRYLTFLYKINQPDMLVTILQYSGRRSGLSPHARIIAERHVAVWQFENDPPES